MNVAGDSLNGSGRVEVKVAEVSCQDVVDKAEAMLVDVEVPESSWVGVGTLGDQVDRVDLVVREDAVETVVGTQAQPEQTLVERVQLSEPFRRVFQTVAMAQQWLV